MKNLIFKIIVFSTIICCELTAQISFKDVAGIFYNRCTSCHHTNGGAPHSFMNYAKIFSKKALIFNELSNNHMPPWPADTTYMRFIGEHIISLSEKQALIYWISSGALKGDTTLAPNAPNYPKYKLNGIPDLELKMPTFISNASATTDAYNVFALPTGLTSGRTIRAIEFVPGNSNIVHHVVIMGDGTGTSVSDLSGNAFSMTGNIGIMGYQPGAEPIIFPNSNILKSGIDLPAGSQILFQMHYPAGSGGQIDSSKIRIYFYPTSTLNIRQMYIMVPLQYWRSDFWIAPPNASTLAIHNPIKSFEVDTFNYNTFPVSIFSALPHSHQICTKVINFAYEDTSITHSSFIDTIPLLKINNWNFHWQFYYYYKKLVKIPPGYRYYAKHTYDNTSSNPHNPNSPPQMITVGTNSGNEMLYDSFQWMVYNAGDENINIDSIIKSDPLYFNPLKVNSILKDYKHAFVYPNPFNEAFTIQVIGINSLIGYDIKLFDIAGREIIPEIKKMENSFELNLKSILTGTYIYTILNKNHDAVLTGKIIKQ